MKKLILLFIIINLTFIYNANAKGLKSVKPITKKYNHHASGKGHLTKKFNEAVNKGKKTNQLRKNESPKGGPKPPASPKNSGF